MSPQQHNLRRGEVGLDDLLTVLLLFLSVVVGVRYGIRWGAAYGILGAVGGGIVGFVAGVAFTMLTRLLAASISWPFEAFGRWWRPYPPPCENRTCTKPDQYQSERLADEIRKTRPDLSAHGYRCQCGDVYTQLRGARWVRVLPDGSLKPYLVYRPFGRWQRDPAMELPPHREVSELMLFGVAGAALAVLGLAALVLTRFLTSGALEAVGTAGVIGGATLLLLTAIAHVFGRRRSAETAATAPESEQTSRPDVSDTQGEWNIPGWALPVILTFVIGGCAFLAMLLETGFKDAVSRWLVVAGAALGLIVGTVIWLGQAWRQRQITHTGRDPLHVAGFFGTKAFSLLPGALAIAVWITPPPEQSTMGNLAVSFITGGLFLVGFFIDGLSLHQSREGHMTGLNRYCRPLPGLGIALLVIGFALAIVAAP